MFLLPINTANFTIPIVSHSRGYPSADTILLVHPLGRAHPRRDLLAVALAEVVEGRGGGLGVRERDGAWVLVESLGCPEGRLFLGPGGSTSYLVWGTVGGGRWLRLLLLISGGRGRGLETGEAGLEFA